MIAESEIESIAAEGVKLSHPKCTSKFQDSGGVFFVCWRDFVFCWTGESRALLKTLLERIKNSELLKRQCDLDDFENSPA